MPGLDTANARAAGAARFNTACHDTTDAAGGPGTIYPIGAGDTFFGALADTGDSDRVAIYLTTSTQYLFDPRGFSGVGPLDDPTLRLYSASGSQVAIDDDGGIGLESHLGYTAPASAVFDLSARGDDRSYAGSYQLGADAGSPATLNELAAYLTTGYWQESGRQARSFDTSSSNVITVDLTGLTTAGTRLAGFALQAWEMIANVRFAMVSFGADITFDDSAAGAFTNSSLSGNTILSSHVNVSVNWLNTYGTQLDGYAFQTYIHEIGHALGLGHQGHYNGSAVYSLDATFVNDSWNESIMSYFDQDQNTWVNADYADLLTPMMADIIAIQNLYGPPVSGATIDTSGNTVWGANSNLGGYMSLFFDTLSGISQPVYFGNNPTSFTIYDRGGVDLLDTSYSSANDTIDLRAAHYSTVGGIVHNIGIAGGVTIENAVTGSGDNRVTGNHAGNMISTGAGSDRVAGGAGNDRLYGGSQNDMLRGGGGNDRLYGGKHNDTLYGGAGTDLAIGNRGGDILHGGGGDDHLVGGAGSDRLYGELGRDVMAAGNDTSRDVFVFTRPAETGTSAATRDLVRQFDPGEDVINLVGIDANTNLVGNQAFGFSNGAHAYSVWIRDIGANMVLRGDTNGDGVADFSIEFAKVSGIGQHDILL